MKQGVGSGPMQRRMQPGSNSGGMVDGHTKPPTCLDSQELKPDIKLIKNKLLHCVLPKKSNVVCLIIIIIIEGLSLLLYAYNNIT